VLTSPYFSAIMGSSYFYLSPGGDGVQPALERGNQMRTTTKKRPPRVILIQGVRFQKRSEVTDRRPSSVHSRHSVGSKIVVVLSGLPLVTTNQGRTEQRDGRRAARMMMPKR
jgi:hypothetical protein